MIALDLPQKVTPRPPKRTKVMGTFGGAASNRLTADWFTVLISADRAARSSLKTLRARSRQVCQDNPHASGLQASFTDNIVGHCGIGVQPRMRSPRGKLLKKENNAAWLNFQRWGERGTCTADGQQSWGEFQRLVFKTWFSDGEAFVRRLAGFGNEYGYALQLIDADQLDEAFNAPASPGRNEIVQGIEINRWGRPVAYHFWVNHPSETQREKRRERIEAKDIIHLFEAVRPGQHRGLPILTPVLIAMKLLDGYTVAEVTAAHVAAAQGGFFTMTGEDAAALGQAEDDVAKDEEGNPIAIEMEAEPGLARKLPPGWSFNQWSPEHPNGNFGEFQKNMLRMIARGVNTSAITASGDLSDTSYSSGRVGLQAERDAYKAMQVWFGGRLVSPVYRDVLSYSTLAGQVRLPTPDASLWSDHELEPRGWGWIDPQKDMETMRGEIGMGINSPQRVCAALGRDYEEILDDIEAAKQMCAERGIEWPNFAAPNTPQQRATDTSTPPPSPGKSPPTNGNGNGNGHGANRIDGLLPLEVTR